MTVAAAVREYIYLDYPRVQSLAAQLGASAAPAPSAVEPESLFANLEPLLLSRPGAVQIGQDFDFGNWTAETFTDGKVVSATGAVRLLDYAWLAEALGSLPAVLKKMSKLEMAALRNSEEGKRLSKSALQARSLENQAAIQKIEEFRVDELSESVRKLYGDIVRLKVRPSRDQPRALLVGSCYARHFYDTPAALSQKYGLEIDAGWSIVAQVNAGQMQAPAQALPIGNQTEDAFEQIALLMNNAFKVANAPAFPAVSVTPIAIYRPIA